MLNISEKFGNILFGEQNNLPIFDFERSLMRYFSKINKRPHGKYQFAEINNHALHDYKRAIFKS
ncbi:MAG: hypothetical protein ACOC44_07385 [Promethearchaeia archaeon]